MQEDEGARAAQAQAQAQAAERMSAAQHMAAIGPVVGFQDVHGSAAPLILLDDATNGKDVTLARLSKCKGVCECVSVCVCVSVFVCECECVCV